MEIEKIKELINIFDSSKIEKMKLENEDFKICLEKNTYSKNDKLKIVNGEENLYTGISEKTEEKNKLDNSYIFKAPLVGTFYSAPSPESKRYVNVGDEVKVDDVICIVEAMKMINEIKSPVNGKIIEVLVDNEDLLEYDQPIFKIEVVNV